ncbi:MAG: acylphosphatase [Acidobacteriota bacterium]
MKRISQGLGFLAFTMPARRFIIRGRVQGVGFRYFTVQAATRARVVGTVKNLPDGSVEAIAEGSLASLAAFLLELRRGPGFSRVTAVDEQDYPAMGHYKSFEVIY